MGQPFHVILMDVLGVTVTKVPLGNLPSHVTRYRIYLPTTSEFSPFAFLAGERMPLNQPTLA